MPASVAEFVQAAENSGILTRDVLAEYTQNVAPETDATPLANRLVKAGRLSAFQAKYIYGGKAKSLLLGPYVVLDVLGKGGMGYVYKAEHRRMRRMVALKVISKAALKSPDAVRRFEREVQAAARLEHPNIVTAHDAGEASGTHYLVMQYVDGRNLSEVVKELGPQPVGRTIDWILQAARGLEFAHEHGVIHRDIKPGNLLVDSRGTVKILDMGLARLETLDADQDQLTGTGQIMGTVDYMAPEQAVDTRQADARSDVYSLGVTLWYLLTGRPLFAGNTAMNKMMAHMQAAVPQLASERGDIPAEVEAAFQRMVAKKPADRFQSMREVIAALEALPQGVTAPGPPCVLLGDGPASLGPPGMAVTQTLQRHKIAVADANTERLSAVVVDTQTSLGKIEGPKTRHLLGLKHFDLIVGSGAVGALVLIGVIAFAFSGRRGGAPESVSSARAAAQTTPIGSMPVAGSKQSTQTATPVVPAVVLDHRFQQPSDQFPEGVGKHITVAYINEELCMTMNHGGLWWPAQPLLHNLQLRDFACEVEGRFVRPLNGGGWGLGLRYQDNPWTGFVLTTDDSVFVRSYDEEDLLPYFKLGANPDGSSTHRLRIERRGSETLLYVDDTFIRQIHIPNSRPCHLTLYLTGQPGLSASFRSIRVWELRGE